MVVVTVVVVVPRKTKPASARSSKLSSFHLHDPFDHSSPSPFGPCSRSPLIEPNPFEPVRKLRLESFGRRSACLNLTPPSAKQKRQLAKLCPDLYNRTLIGSQTGSGLEDRIRKGIVKMAEFVRAQIFGTTFEITSRYGLDISDLVLEISLLTIDRRSDTQICSLWAWGHLVWFGMSTTKPKYKGQDADQYPSSAKDQLTQQAVAVKKIMKPFSTSVLSKRTYRELKLLKHLRHENVGNG